MGYNGKKSMNASLVADDVLDRISNHKKINLSEIQRNRGYTPKSANAMVAIKTRTYKEKMTPVIERMKRQRDKILTAMDNRDLQYEAYIDLSNSLYKLNHDIELLSGRATARDEVVDIDDATYERIVRRAQERIAKGKQE